MKNKKELKLSLGRIVLDIFLLILLFVYVIGYGKSYPNPTLYNFSQFFIIVMVYGMLLLKLNPIIIEYGKNTTKNS